MCAAGRGSGCAEGPRARAPGRSADAAPSPRCGSPTSLTKTRSSSEVQCSRLLSWSRANAAWSTSGTERTLPDFVGPSESTVNERRTKTTRRVQSMSPQRSPRISPSRRPVNAATRKITESCSVTACVRQQLDLVGLERGEVARAALWLALGPGDRIAWQVVDALGALEDRVQLLEALVDRPGPSTPSSTIRPRNASTSAVVISEIAACARRTPGSVASRSPVGSRGSSTAGACGRTRRSRIHSSQAWRKVTSSPGRGSTFTSRFRPARISSSLSSACDRVMVSLGRAASLQPSRPQPSLKPLPVGGADLRVEHRAARAFDHANEACWPGRPAHHLRPSR